MQQIKTTSTQYPIAELRDDFAILQFQFAQLQQQFTLMREKNAEQQKTETIWDLKIQ